LFTLIICASNQISAEDFRTAALTPGTELLRQSDLPTVLSSADQARYERIFALETRGDWHEADGEIAALQNRLLLGPVLAARYLSSSYHASYPELTGWLQTYADEPDAKVIYKLALHRQPKGAKAPPKPVAATLDEQVPDEPAANLSPRAVLVVRQIESLVPTAPRRAEQLLAGPEAQHILDSGAKANLRAEIAAAFLGNGEAQEALAASTPAEDGDLTPQQHWEAGLAAWRLDRLAEARTHFEALVRNPGQSPWLKSEAAVWSARVALRLKQPKLVAYFLRIAAEQPRTFYGLIACRLLGIDPGLNFEPEPFTALDAHVISSLESGRRALALLEVGERVRAVAELRTLTAGHNPALLQSLAGIAQHADLAALSMSAGQLLAQQDGRRHDGAVYPMPRWTPHGGFTVDRALLFAVMRQESLFLPDATSAVGAAGLMQLMPATARDMAAREGVQLAAAWDEGPDAKSLADPSVNLTLAQEYVRLLLKDDRIKGNLLLFTLAYNGGPAATQRWDELASSYKRDPLLFLESIPSPEGRLFTKHVLTNYWIYRARLGQSTPDLDALAAGKWPTYIALDRAGPGQRYAENR